MRASRSLAAISVSSVLLAGAAWAQAESPKNYLWKECYEDVLLLQLNPGPLQQVAGPEFSLALEEGKARVAIVVQDCSRYWIDGEDLGPTQHAHVWVAVEGPQGVDPVAGAQHTLPTASWLSLSAGSTNPRGREARAPSGTAPGPLEGVVLDPPAPERGGRVAVAEGLSYSWKASSVPPPVSMLGVNHYVYVRQADGTLALKVIQALAKLATGLSEGTLEVVGGTDSSGLIGPGTYPVEVYTFHPIWARATLGAEPPG